MKVVIDAGHGFSKKTNSGDKGAVNGGLWECTATLATAKILVKKLKELGHTVIETRPDENFVTLANRCDISNNANADLFISIHCNSSTNKTAQGIETWKYVGTNNPVAISVQKNLIEMTGAKNRGIKDGTFYVLKHTKARALLVEMGFISNEEEKLKLFNADYQETVANAIVKGIQDSF